MTYIEWLEDKCLHILDESWVCDLMSEHPDEWEYCTKHCENGKGECLRRLYRALCKTEPNSSEKPNNCEPQIIACPIQDDYAWIYKDEPQPFDKPPKCLGCLYSDLDKAFHPCASCVDFGKYVGEVSGKDEPQKCYLQTSCDHYGDKQVCGQCREYNLYSHTKTEPSDSEKPNNHYACEDCINDLWNTPRICGKCVRQEDGKPSMYEPKTEPQDWKDQMWTEAVEVEKTEPQTETHGMTEDDAFYIVFKDLTKDEGLFTGRYDAKNGSRQYMHGINSVMEYIAYKVGDDCYNAWVDRFAKNMIESQEKAERSEK